MIDTTTASGRLMSRMFVALAEFERELIAERVKLALPLQIKEASTAAAHMSYRP